MRTPIGIRYTVEADYPEFLRDESRCRGQADSISFPADERELRAHLAWAYGEGIPVTVQGARTGITGGAVPAGGHVLSLWRMRRILGLRLRPEGGWYLRVEPGVLLADVQACLRDRTVDTTGWSAADRDAWDAFERGPASLFPPDLTEVSASVGGLAANNGSGARSFRYGAARNSIRSARIVLADGDVLALERGRERVTGGRYEIVTEGGRELVGTLPAVAAPDAVKCVCGYYLHPDMDVLDLFVGSEGTLGVFSELELVVLPMPPAIWGVTCLMPSETAALGVVEGARAARPRPAAIEYIDANAIALLRREAARHAMFSGLPPLPAEPAWAVYVEYHADSAAEAEAAVMALGDLVERSGGDPEATWLADSPHAIERFKQFRHAVPECINRLIDERRQTHPDLVKLGTDLAVPDAALREMMALYRRDLEARGLEYAVFGHIGNNHVHVNIIPRTPDEYRIGRELYRTWARRAVELGGSVSGEHGIGKLKRELLADMLGADGLAALQSVKQLFDPDGRLGPGTLWEPADRAAIRMMASNGAGNRLKPELQTPKCSETERS